MTLLVATGCGAAALGPAARSAADRWEAACGARPAPESVTVVHARSIRCGSVTDAVGCTHLPDGAVTVADGGSVGLEDLLLHEFGHVLGARHLATGVAGVMAATIQSDQWRPCLTQADLDAVPWCPAPRPEC